MVALAPPREGTTMTKLTSLQKTLLEGAASTDDGFIGDTSSLDEAKTKAAVKALINAGQLISSPVEGQASTLMITSAGRNAIGLGTVVMPEPAARVIDAPAVAEAAAGVAEPKGKLGLVIALLRQPQGTTVEAMMAATGWQAHSVRGALSGAIKKGRGLTVLSEKSEGGRVYRVAAGAEA